jgi:phenylalanyl-tRNA synthetase beta chain
MATAKFSRKEFEKYIKLTKEIEEKISLFGTHLESINEEEVELEITPNRPDLFSLQGFIRNFSAFLGKPIKKEYKIKSSGLKIIVDKSVEKIRPFSMAAIVKNVKFTDEKIKDIMQWQEKIHATLGRNRKKIAIGYYVLDKIKFPVKYLAEEPKKISFIPLDTNEKMNGLQILQKHPTGREYSYQLESFDKFPVYYDSNKEVLSMPPIINSNELGKIIPGTSNILVECTGTNLETLKKVISMAVFDLIDCGGEAYSIDVIYGDKKEFIDLKPEKMKVNLDNVNKLLGLDLKENELKRLLEKMGYSYNSANKTAEIPAYRTDIMHEVDLIEDIAIAYGYNNFAPEIPQISTIGEIDKTEIFKKKISEILCGLNMIELSTYHLLTKDEAKLFNLKEKEIIEVEKSKSDYKILKPNLLISTLNILSKNIDREYPQRVFELGKIFELDQEKSSETGISEKNKLCIALASNNSNFTEIKQILDYLARMLNKEYFLEPSNESPNSFFIDGRCGKIIINNKPIGYIGEIKPQILSSLGIKMPIAALELEIEELMG